ncbi:pyridoxine 5'-phosphate synthase [Striga asiatica]|uniref:Pyridoxine 5'-phosphate synthase n=1 Tax=Striga asiatica TaxID=4170 RepID=A0A5A7PB50_STRAF|nr:pyridoxine 5'-phosphate synthase [Striga asiatica]
MQTALQNEKQQVRAKHDYKKEQDNNSTDNNSTGDLNTFFFYRYITKAASRNLFFSAVAACNNGRQDTSTHTGICELELRLIPSCVTGAQDSKIIQAKPSAEEQQMHIQARQSSKQSIKVCQTHDCKTKNTKPDLLFKIDDGKTRQPGSSTLAEPSTRPDCNSPMPPSNGADRALAFLNRHLAKAASRGHFLEAATACNPGAQSPSFKPSTGWKTTKRLETNKQKAQTTTEKEQPTFRQKATTLHPIQN